MESNIVDNHYVKFWIEDGILFCYYKKTATIDLQAAKSIVADRISICSGKSFPCVTDVSEVKEITREARGFLAQEENSDGIVKAAFVVSSSLTKLIASFFVLVDNPKVPCRIFNSIDSAVKWIKRGNQRL